MPTVAAHCREVIMHVAKLRSLFGLAAILLLGIVGCTVVVDEPRPGPRPGGICTREYDPVCARRGDQQRTFSNACLADGADWRVVHRGECRRQEPPRERACTREYAPVCARRGDQRRTFPNGCEADRADWRVVHSGECRSSERPPREERFCTREYAPVCARRGDQRRTFPNACEARSAEFRIVRDGPC
jgi:hypothetical protein